MGSATPKDTEDIKIMTRKAKQALGVVFIVFIGQLVGMIPYALSAMSIVNDWNTDFFLNNQLNFQWLVIVLMFSAIVIFIFQRGQFLTIDKRRRIFVR